MTTKVRYGTSKQGVPYYVYYDLDSHGYRTATTSLESEALMPNKHFCQGPIAILELHKIGF